MSDEKEDNNKVVELRDGQGSHYSAENELKERVIKITGEYEELSNASVIGILFLIIAEYQDLAYE